MNAAAIPMDLQANVTSDVVNWYSCVPSRPLPMMLSLQLREVSTFRRVDPDISSIT